MAVESRITEVTLYARGARVRRTVMIAQVEPRIRIVDLPVAVIDDTVRVTAEGGASVTAVHVGLDVPAPERAAEEVVAEVRAARRGAALADAEVERLEAALAIVAAAPVAIEPSGDEPPPPWGAIVDARRGLVALRAARELAVREQLAAARRVAFDAHRALSAALDRERRTGSARPAKLHELRKHVDLEIEGSGAATMYLEYQVAAARWAPSYVARLDGDRATFEVRAAVAQSTGEDWNGVKIRLSTAEPERWSALPELAPQRIGRRQPEPARLGFRPPPMGAASLYLDYLQGFPERPPPRKPDEPRLASVIVDPMVDAGGGWEEETSRAKKTFALGGAPQRVASISPPPPMPLASIAPPAPPAPQPMSKTIVPVLAQSAAPIRTQPARAPRAPGTAGGGGADEERAGKRAVAELVPADAPAPPPAPAPRLDYGNLRMAPPGSRDRGTLVPVPRDPRRAAFDGEIAAGVRSVSALPLPPGCSTDWPHTYDYAFATDGAVDVRSDGGWHSIAVTAKPTTAVLRHVAVPREQADVFRLTAIANPLPGPLLPGPVDVYDRGKFLVTSAVLQTAPGAEVEIALGVDPQVKLARNTEFKEETTGVLRGGLRLLHAIVIDVDNLTERAIDLEVRERLPVTREGDDEVDIVVGRIEPPWERWTPDPDAPGQPRLRGGYRWRLPVPARTKRTLRAAYEVKIGGKLELVGGNRRES